MARARGRRFAGLASLAVIAAVVALGFVVVPSLIDRYGDRYFSNSTCTATLDGESFTLTAQQTENAAIVGSYVVRAGLPPKAGLIALSTALQESGLRNVKYGDRDSLGLFQQRPSQGWGTAEEVSNPRYATGAFYKALVKIDGWESMSVTDAAQAVQRSAFPDAYAEHEREARPWAAALAGDAGLEAVTCKLPKSTPSPSAVSDFQLWVRQNYGKQVTATAVSSDGDRVVVSLDHESGEYRDALAAWAVASASTQPIEAVSWCAQSWSRATGQWSTDAGRDAPSDCPAGTVTVTLATTPQP